MTHITHTKEQETVQTDYLEERVTVIHRNCSKVFPTQSNSGVSLKQKKHEDENSKISGIRSNQDILKDKKEIANTIYNCFSKLGLYEGEYSLDKILFLSVK